jgi:hypothetical protein
MLFDLRGRGRRRTVRIVYTGLAVLMGFGLIALGIGGGFGSGGILSAFTGNEGSSSGASFAAEVSKYRKLTQKEPHSAAAWAGLTKALLHEAGLEGLATSTGLTSKGKEVYSEAAQAWNGYLALNPSKPNSELAKRMVVIYGEEGLNEPANAVAVLQLVVADEPKSAAAYSQLAEYAYKAKNPRVGDLAAAKAVALAPAAERKRLQTLLAEYKKNPSGERNAETVTEGKRVVGKVKSNGTFTGTVAGNTTPQPATSTTGTTKK